MEEFRRFLGDYLMVGLSMVGVLYWAARDG
jgi:hypothetical protein